MKRCDKEVYPRVWRVVGLLLASTLLVMGGAFMISDPPLAVFKYLGYVAVVFFSLGVLIGLGWLLLKALHKPLARIYDDRLEYLIPARMRYEVIPFVQVELFVIVKMGETFIRADYLQGGFKNTGISSSLVNVGELCDILNDKLDEFWLQSMLSQPLDRLTVTKCLTAMGVEPCRFDFDTTSRPGCMVVMRDGSRFQLVYVDDRGGIETISNHLTENDACHALLENFIKKEAFKSQNGIK